MAHRKWDDDTHWHPINAPWVGILVLLAIAGALWLAALVH